MNKRPFGLVAVLMCVLAFAGCSLLGPDAIVGKRRRVSVGPLPTVVISVVDSGTRTKSGSAFFSNPLARSSQQCAPSHSFPPVVRLFFSGD
jgi:hypothetical protein